MARLLPDPQMFGGWKVYMRRIVELLEARLPSVNTVPVLPGFGQSRLPNASQDGLMIFVPDAPGGGVPRYSYNNAWNDFGGSILSGGVVVQKSITGLGNNTFTHNLGLAATPGVPNVYWIVFGWQHNGVGAGVGDVLGLNYQGGTVGTNAVDLYVTAAGGRTVDGSNPLTLELYVEPR